MTTPSNPPGALDGLRVLDLSTDIAGGIATMLLADLGAETIRVEREPDDLAGAELVGAPMWHRNKVVVPGGGSGAGIRSGEVAALLANADVVVTSSDEDVAALGLAAHTDVPGEQWAAGRLIHLHMPPYVLGAADPYEADALLAATAGTASRQSSFDGGPVESVYPHLSYEQGAWGAATAIAALIERERSGLGQRVVVDGLHGALVATTPTLVIDPSAPAGSTAVGAGGPNPVYSTYRCADGQWLFLGALTAKFQAAAFRVLGISEVLDDARIDHSGDRLFHPDNRDWVRARIAAAVATRPRAEWLGLLAENDCPSGPVEHRAGWLAHEQIVALGQRREVEDPKLGHVAMPWVPVELSATPAIAPVARRYAATAGWTGGETAPTASAAEGGEASARRRGPLSGITVLDLGTILAGPYTGMLMAELGADVVKVEPPQGDSFRVTGFQYNRGQRSIAVDLRAEAGHAAFLRLVERADVVVDNYRPGVLQRLAIDYDSLVRTKPDIVSVSVTGYGAVGPLAGRPGFDPLLQAQSGMMAAQGGDSDPVFFTLAVNDVTAACFSVLGACAALYHRLVAGEGQQVTTALASVSAFMQCGELLEYAGRPSAPIGGRDYRGGSPLRRYYRSSDGWVRLSLSSAEQLGELIDGEGGAAEQLADRIASAIASVPAAEVQSRLTGGIAIPARTLPELIDDALIMARRYFEPLVRADGKTFYVPGRYAFFSRSQVVEGLRPPGLGEHSRDVLTEIGCDPDELVSTGVVVAGGPMTEFGAVSYR